MKKLMFTLVLIVGLGLQGTFAQSWIEALANETGTTIQDENLIVDNNPDDQEEVLNDEDDLWEASGSVLFYTGYRHCEINGETVPCDEVLEEAFEFSNAMLQANPFFHHPENWIPELVSFWIKTLVIGGILSAIGFVFWLWMLIDAIKYEKDNKVMRILIIVFFWFLGALVYLFAEKIGRKEEPTKTKS